MTWTVPTLKHHRHNEKKRELGVPDSASLPVEHHPNPVAHCECGRITTDDMLTDLRSLPRDLREMGNFGNADFLCDGCLETAFREGRIAHHDFYGALGAKTHQPSHDAWKEYTKHYPYPRGTTAHQRKQEDGLLLP